MQPVVTPDEMAAIDAAAPEPVDELIERAAWAVAAVAADMLGPSLYGKRITVFAGGGNNGADGRRAVPHLERRGARCRVVEVPTGPGVGVGVGVPEADLIIDACYGTGLRRDFDRADLPLPTGDVPVLAVDIPSGVDGLTGQLRGRPLRATVTVTFAAHKPGLLLDPGRRYAGAVRLADIGLDCSRATTYHLEPSDIAERWPRRSFDAHKWRHAVHIVGGSAGMTGAPGLSAAAALRAGAGYVACSIPTDVDGPAPVDHLPIEVVSHRAGPGWAEPVLERLHRFGAAVIGPGLVDRDPAEIGRYLAATETPTVFDAGAIDGLAAVLADHPDALARPGGPLHVITPHEAEFERLLGHRPGPDRVAAVTAAADRLGAVVLLKGSTTVVARPEDTVARPEDTVARPEDTVARPEDTVAGPGRRVLLSTAGDQRLATAGTGDVLAGVIGAGIAGGLEPFLAAGIGAELHGQAAIRGYRVGTTAGDLPSHIADLLSALT